MKKEIRKMCARAIVESDQKCVQGEYGYTRITLGDMAEYAAEACIRAYLKATESNDGKSDGK